MKSRFGVFLLVPAVLLLVAGLSWSTAKIEAKSAQSRNEAEDNASRLIEQGRQIFRFDTFGDEVFWSDQLQMQRSVMSLSPQTALALGLKVDSDALPASVIEAIRHGKVNLNDPAVTLQLIRQNAVLPIELRSHFLPLNSCTASSMATMFSTGVAACRL
jgi:hypothetical protein